MALSEVHPIVKHSYAIVGVILVSLRFGVANASSYVAPYPEKIIKTIQGHFDSSPNASEVAVWSQRADNGVHVIRVVVNEGDRWRTIARGYHASVYDLQVGDIEGRGHDDIVVGLTQRAKLDVVERPRIHVYAVDPGKGFRPLWRGSSLSYPFRNFRVWPFTASNGNAGPARLVAIERNPLADYAEFEWVSVYRWNGFGFIVDWQTPVRGKITDLSVQVKPTPSITFTQNNQGAIRTIRVAPDPWRSTTVNTKTASTGAVEISGASRTVH